MNRIPLLYYIAKSTAKFINGFDDDFDQFWPSFRNNMNALKCNLNGRILSLYVASQYLFMEVSNHFEVKLNPIQLTQY